MLAPRSLTLSATVAGRASEESSSASIRRSPIAAVAGARRRGDRGRAGPSEAMSRQARSCSSAAPASRCASAPVLVYTPDIRTVASSARVPRDHAAARSRAGRLRASSSDSCTRSSSGSTPSIASVHSGSWIDDRELTTPAARDLVLEHGREHLPPPGNARDAGSTPTETTVRRPRQIRSLPAAAERTELDRLRSAPAPARSRRCQSQRITQRAESDLSVRPISTCLASLVTFGSANPASAAARAGDLDRLGQPAIPAAANRSCTALSSSTDPRLRRILPLRLGDQIDLAPVQPLRDDPSGEPTRRQPLHRQLRRARQGRVLVCCRPPVAAAALRSTRNLEPRLSASTALRTAGRAQLTVDAHVRAAHDASSSPAAHASSTRR